MNNYLKDGLTGLGNLGRRTLDKTTARLTSEASIRALRQGISRGRVQTGASVRAVSDAQVVRQAAGVVRVAVNSGTVREVAQICGRAGVAGAVVDGAMGGIQAIAYVRDGKIDMTQAAKHVSAEAGCGFVTSSAGTAGTLAAYMITGAMGPAALAAGMGASLGSRFVYRKIVGETLPADEPAGVAERKDDDADVMEDIGPRPQ